MNLTREASLPFFSPFPTSTTFAHFGPSYLFNIEIRNMPVSLKFTLGANDDNNSGIDAAGPVDGVVGPAGVSRDMCGQVYRLVYSRNSI